MIESKQVVIEWDSLPWTERLDKLHQIARGAALDNRFRIFVVNEILKPANVNEYDNLGQAKALYRWAKREIYYVHEAGEHLQHPLVTAEHKLGDCDDFALFLAAGAHSIGLPYRFVLAGKGWESRNGDEVPEDPTHIYVEIGTPALSDFKNASHTMRIGVPYYSADAVDPSHFFGRKVSMAGPVLTEGNRPYIITLVVLVLLALWRLK